MFSGNLRLDISNMRFSILAFAASLATLAAASPLTNRAPTINTTTPFYLLTTTSATYRQNSSLLPNVSLTTLFDPYYQPNYLLRLIAPGYGSVPQFTLSNGVLHTPGKGPHGIGDYIFNSSDVHTGSELEFRTQYEGTGDLSLEKGYLLAVNGSTHGWTICVEELGQEVIEWKGTDKGCTRTYIQAALTVPY
ncbi:hypothetical protein E4T52_11972 [Aureobasidium sp. EXF-3400]|nr:hypothetical protein E4T51_11003 [Aureobasidium sp. EXF-12344]KAI4773052.1 hypothetical protein E4T52_11972 [Aureobasidium sp. EXF-3400]